MKGDTNMKFLKVLFDVIIVLVIAWFAISLLEIGFGNCAANPTYHPLNLFLLMKGLSA